MYKDDILNEISKVHVPFAILHRISCAYIEQCIVI